MQSRVRFDAVALLGALAMYQAAAYAQSSSLTVQYSYDAQGRLSTATESDTTVRTYVYENTSFPNALTGVVDENNGRYLTWGYDNTSGLATSGSEAGGADSATLTYNSAGSTTVTDALGAVRVFTFGRYGDRSLVIGISGSRCSTCSELKTTTYDAYGFLSSRTDYNNNVNQYTYDDNRGLELSRTEAQSTPRARTITTGWNSTYHEPMSISVYAGGTATGTALRTTSFTYDGSGNDQTRTVTDPATSASRTWTYTYDGYGRMLTAKAPRTDLNSTTTYTYYTCTTGYQCGELHTVTDAVGNLTTYNTYNAYGQPLTITDPNSVVTTLTYDNRLRLKSRQVGTETTGFSYYPTGLLQTVTLPDGSTLTYTYDGAHRLTQVADGSGNKVIYTLDAMGNRTAENSYDPTSVLHSTHTRVINTLNEIYQEINAAGTAAVTTTFGYDSNGNQTSIAAPLARNTTNAYDELNRLDQITDPNSGITKFTYDANDNLTSVLDPRTLATGYTYNGLGDLTQLTSPDTAGTSHTYDSGGNLATSTDARGAISTYTYDAQNRVKTVAYKLGSTTDLTETYTYDTGTNGKGHLTGASDANHSMSWGYDALVRVVSKGQKIGSVTKTVGYAFTNGDLTTLTTPSGQTVTYGYNTNHQVTSISIGGVALLGAVTYEPLGPANGWTWANNTTEIRSYDTDANPNQVSAIESHTYGYDDALRITSIANGSNSALSWTYGFDLLDRITSASKTGLTQDWTYDANGNRLTETGTVAGSYNVSATSNRLNSITGSPARIYTYDNAGNTLTYANTLTYYNNGRMKTAKVGSSTTTYVYNALGQRVKKSGGSAGTVLMFYDEAGHILGEYSSTGALVQETVWMGDIPVATIRPNGSTTAVYNVHADHLNAPRMVTQSSSTNKIAWRWDTDPFATVTPNQNPAGLGTFKYNLRYPGQYFDSETGLLQNYFRDYDPAVGKYVESDPIGLRGGINTYGYVGENPLSNFDSFGLSSLIFNPATGTMTVVNGDGVAVGVFPAGNNTDSHSRGAWPAGDYDYSRHTTHPDDAPDSAFGSYGNYIFNVPGCHDQCGVHSGRNSVPDGLGRIGVKHATNGCIRTTDAAMQLIANLINGGDPLTGVMVTSSFVPTNIPAIAPGLPGGPPLYLPDPGR